MSHDFYNTIEDNPIIAAINNVNQVDDAIKSKKLVDRSE